MTVAFLRRAATPSRAARDNAPDNEKTPRQQGEDFALRARAGCAGESATVMDRRYISSSPA
jgi:hypothetical protein